jgi:hypothetical protein
MSGQIVFGDGQKDDINLVKEVFLQRLREDPSWSQVNEYDEGFGRYLSFPNATYQQQFSRLANEVFWELIGLGIVIPGSQFGGSTAGANLPHFRVTQYGKRVLAAGRPIPHDPEGYLKEVRASAPSCVGEVALGYLEEALRCFSRQCYTACVLLIGVAAEAAFLDLCELVTKSIRDSGKREKFEKLGDRIKERHRWMVAQYDSLPARVRREQLPDGLDLTLGTLYDLIRRQRNELGHPQAVPPAVDREHAFVSFQLFMTYVRDAEVFAKFCQKNGW